MERKLYKKEERGLRGGPNYQVSEMMGSVTSTGYWPDSPDRNNDFNIIPSNNITMEGMDMDLIGQDDEGNTQYMTPGNNYNFPGNYVTETPVAQQGGIFLGNYTFKDGGLVRMEPGGLAKKKKRVKKEKVTKINYNVDNSIFPQNAAPYAYFNPKKNRWARPPEDLKEGEYVDLDKYTPVIATKTFELSGGKKVSPREAARNKEKYRQELLNTPEGREEERQRLMREFVDNENAHKSPLQASLGNLSLDNPATRDAARNYAAYKLGESNPLNAFDRLSTGRDTPTTHDFYRPHEATFSFGIPAAAVMAPIVAEGAAAAAPYIGEGFQVLRTAAKPMGQAWNTVLNAPRFGNNALTLGNAFKTLSAYDLSHKYIPNTIEAGQMYNETGDTKYLKDMGYNAAKGFLETSSSIGPFMQEMSAAKKPVSLIDDARKMADADKDMGSRTLSGVKTFKNTLGYMKEQGGLVRMDPGGPAGSSFQPSYDNSKSYAENMELNKRAQAAGHNSVAEYEASGWAWQPEKTHFTQGEGQSFRKAQPAQAEKNYVAKAEPDSRSYYDKNLSVQHVVDEAKKNAPLIEMKRKTEKEKADASIKQFYADKANGTFKMPPINDPAGLPSVPIFESLLMAPVAAGEAGLTGLVRAAPAVGTAIWDGLGSLGSTLGSELASVGSSVGEGFNAVKTFAKPAVDAWNSALGTRLLGAAEMGASPNMQAAANLMTPANLLKAWGLYDLTTKYAPEAVENAQLYNETGDTKYLKDAAYNTGKGLLESFSHTGPIVHEVNAVKRPLSFIDDARKAANAEDNTSKAIYDFKTLKNTMNMLREQGGGVFLGKFKQVGGQLVPHDISVPNLSRQDGGDMPFGLPLKEQNIYTLPEYNQPRNPKTGEILPDPRRPSLGMDTGATEYKYTYSTDEGDIDIPSVVAGQYIGDQALDRYRLTGERFKTMTDPGSYSNFYDQIGQLGLMQEKQGGSVKRVKIKSLPKNWKSQ